MLVITISVSLWSYRKKSYVTYVIRLIIVTKYSLESLVYLRITIDGKIGESSRLEPLPMK